MRKIKEASDYLGASKGRGNGFVEMVGRAVAAGNLKSKAVCGILESMGYSNHTLAMLEMRQKTMNYLRSNYGSMEYLGIGGCQNDCGGSNVAWVYWNDGFDAAPPIVRACRNSVEANLSGNHDVVLLDSKTVGRYIDLPEHVLEKHDKGLISETLYSDFVRLSILYRYGGVWLDSTVLLTGPLPSYVEGSPLFLYTTQRADETSKYESWLIKADPGSEVLGMALSIMCDYWKSENRIRDYFLVFLCLTLAFERFPETDKAIPKVPYELPLMLGWSLEEEFDASYWDLATSLTSVHKLSYKVNVDAEGTFYDHVLAEWGER